MSLVLFEDVRNKPGKHKNIEAYCRQTGIEIVRQSLNVGDYQISNKGDIVVDTKSGVRELAMDCFQDHDRFRAECERAQRFGIKLIILTEEMLPNGRLDMWKSPINRSGFPVCKFDPAALRKVLITMQKKYDVLFRFCDPRSTGKQLIEYLKGERQ